MLLLQIPFRLAVSFLLSDGWPGSTSVFQEDSKKFLWKKDAFKKTVQSSIQDYPSIITMKNSGFVHYDFHSMFFSVLPLSGFHLHIEPYVSSDDYLQCNHSHFPKPNLMLFPYTANVFRVYVILYYSFVLAKFAVLSTVVLEEGLIASSRALWECDASESKEIFTPHWTIWPTI